MYARIAGRCYRMVFVTLFESGVDPMVLDFMVLYAFMIVTFVAAIVLPKKPWYRRKNSWR